MTETEHATNIGVLVLHLEEQIGEGGGEAPDPLIWRVRFPWVHLSVGHQAA